MRASLRLIFPKNSCVKVKQQLEDFRAMLNADILTVTEESYWKLRNHPELTVSLDLAPCSIEEIKTALQSAFSIFQEELSHSCNGTHVELAKFPSPSEIGLPSYLFLLMYIPLTEK